MSSLPRLLQIPSTSLCTPHSKTFSSWTEIKILFLTIEASMDATKIKQLLANRCGRAFLGVFPIDMLPKTLPPHRPLLLVCNTKPHDNRGEHWIVLFIDSTGEYFDSFA